MLSYRLIVVSQTSNMVVTPLMWKSMDLLTNTYELIWRNPLEWDVTSKKLIVNPPSTKLIPWLMVVIWYLVSINILSILLLLFQLFGFIHIPLTNLLVLFMVFALFAFVIYLEGIFYLYGDSTAAILNKFAVLEKKLSKLNLLTKLLFWRLNF